MGLAASQARFLAITARKTQCELQSTQIAQDKLSISNELTEATEDYQSALNATKLIWDSDGTGENTYNVSYNLLMTPSAANMYDPYLVTDSSGKIALTTAMATAAQQAGIDPKGGTTPSEAGRIDFINALVNAGVITGSTGSTILDNAYSESAGVGGVPLDKTTAYAVSNQTLANYLSDEAYKLNIADILGTFGESEFATEKKGGVSIAINGNAMSSVDAMRDLTLGDLLNNEYTFLASGGDNQGVEPGSANFNEFLTAVFGGTDNTSIPDLSTNTSSIFGKIANMLTQLLGVDDASQKALDFAYKKIMQNYTNPDRAVSAGSPGSTTDAYNSANSKANEYNAVTYTSDEDLNKKENAYNAVNLSNIVSSFLTYYAQQISSSDYSVSRIDENCYYVTDDMTYMYELANTNAVTEKDLLITDFYNSLYNNICANGWTGAYGDYLEDDQYFQHALKNGQLFISVLATDGYYYQEVYNDNGYLVEITDEDAIAQAELEFEIIKSKLNAKEEKLDLEMKNVDMEISSLTTEYDTVKNLISKNIEKVFTMFQS